MQGIVTHQSNKQIRIRFQNGLSFESGVNDILGELVDDNPFVDSKEPDFIVCGPYGNDIPGKSNYVRMGYYCENITPDLGICDWALAYPANWK